MKIHTVSNNSKNNQTIIFLHGNSSSSKIFQEIITTDLPYQMFAFDLPGHGQSEFSVDIAHYRFANYKEIVLNKISELDGEIILVGNSLGGHIAIEIAKEVQNLKGLIIMGTAPVKYPLNLEEAITPNEALPIYMAATSSSKDIARAFEIVTSNEDSRQMLIDDFNRADPKIRTAIALDLTEGSLGNEYEMLKQLNCAKLIIQGDQEPTVSSQYLREVVEDVNAALFFVENCGHYPSIEQPEQFTKILMEFSKQNFN